MTIRGVISTVLATVLVLMLGLFAYDYYYVRQGAVQGNAAFIFLQKAVADQEAANKAKAQPPMQAPAPVEEKK